MSKEKYSCDRRDDEVNVDHLSLDIESGGGHENDGEPRGQDEPESGIKNLAATGAPNVYVGKRNFIHQMMDVALMMANVSQLKALLSSKNNDYFYILLTFIILSISLQVVFTVCMLAIWSAEKTIEDDHNTEFSQKPNPVIERKKRIASFLDRLGNVLVLFIIVSNVFITGFGVESNGSVAGSSSLTKAPHVSQETMTIVPGY